jgi:hypothetical protein
MNAYELAKEGMEVHSSMPNSPEYQICKAFIEQADRIEKLNEECNNLAITVDSMAEELIKNKGQADRIAELEKNIPHHFGLGHASGFEDASKFYEKKIAELEKEAEECWCKGHSYEYLRAKNRLPQTKQLSDEEIDEIIKQHDWYSKSWIDMVRAIEERIRNGK